MDNDTFTREYISGIQVTIYEHLWYFLALIHKEKKIPMDVIQDFFKTIRSYVTSVKFSNTNN